MMNDITITRTNGGLKRTAAGEDHISGFLYYVPKGTAIPSKLMGVVEILNLEDAENVHGITDVSPYRVLHYHLARFFKVNSNATLYLQVTAKSDSVETDLGKLKDFQHQVNGKLRQIAIYYDEPFATTQVGILQDCVKKLEEQHQPLVVLYAANFRSITDWDTLPSLRESVDAPQVSVIFGEDGTTNADAKIITGKALANAVGKSVTCLGTALGAVSKAAVHQNIGWVENFNIYTSSDNEYSEPAFANGKLLKDVPIETQNAIDEKGYVFLRKHIGLSGTYFNDSYTAIAKTDDYFSIENNRVIYKAIRGIRTALLPSLNSPLLKDPKTGLLEKSTHKMLVEKANNPLLEMQKAGELSGFSVDLSTDVSAGLNFALKLVNIDVARTIDVNIGFTISI